jgi:small subunit ribosomal protein S16
MFRVVVQDARRTPTSGKVVAFLGSYDPHTKAATLEKEKASFYLEHGAQPSERAALLLKKEGVKLPAWVKISTDKSGKLRNPEKLRRNQPEEAKAEPVEEPAAEAEAAAEPAPSEEAPAAEAAPADETPAEETPAEA